MRKNFGSKPWCYPMPVFIVATYDPCSHDYLVVGEKVGNAFKDGLKIKNDK